MNTSPNPTNYDTSEPKSRIAVILVVSVALLLVLIFIVADLIYKGVVSDRVILLQERAPMNGLDLQKQRDREQKLLNTYRWINKEKQQVQIPIEQAMKITIKRYQNNHSR